MRSHLHGPEVVLLASKKKDIIELIEKSYTMTIDEIKNLNQKPDIIKGLIALKKKKEDNEALERANMIADAMIRSLS
jgi:hypothetical protein